MITPGWMVALAVVVWSFSLGWLSHRIFFAPLFRSLEKHLNDQAALRDKGGAK